MASIEPQRTRDDLRWRMVYQRLALELAYNEIAKNLSVDSSTVQRVIERFETTGTVSPAPYPEQHAELHKKLTRIDELLIIHLVADRPSIYLSELQQELLETTGTEVSLSAICKYFHKNGFTRRRLTKVALQRSEKERQQYVSDVSVYNPEMYVFVDETDSDKRDAICDALGTVSGASQPSPRNCLSEANTFQQLVQFAQRECSIVKWLREV